MSAAQVVFGCFILFGASSIAQGIVGGLNGYRAEPEAEPSPVYAAPPAYYPAKSNQPFDPYAGAAVPTQE